MFMETRIPVQKKRRLHTSHVDGIRIADLSAEANHRGVQPCAIMGERISGSTSVSLPGLTVFVSHVALFAVGAYLKQAHRLQAAVSWC